MSKKNQIDNANLFIATGINLEARIIHLVDEIDAVSVSSVIKAMQLMVAKSNEPISIFINTLGGCPYSSFALYDFIRSLENVVVKTHNTGACMSGGTIIFLAGDEKYTYPNSVFMFHTVSSIAEGKLQEMVDESEECKQIFKQMCIIYGNHSKVTAKEWANRLKFRNVYVRTEEARKLELITGVIQY